MPSNSMANPQELGEFIRRTLPDPRALQQISMDPSSGTVRLMWHGREYLVKSTLDVLELKGNQVFVTGGSRLLELSLKTQHKNRNVLAASIEVIRQAEDMLKSAHSQEQGLKLLGTVRNSLNNLMR